MPGRDGAPSPVPRPPPPPLTPSPPPLAHLRVDLHRLPGHSCRAVGSGRKASCAPSTTASPQHQARSPPLPSTLRCGAAHPVLIEGRAGPLRAAAGGEGGARHDQSAGGAALLSRAGGCALERKACGHRRCRGYAGRWGARPGLRGTRSTALPRARPPPRERGATGSGEDPSPLYVGVEKVLEATGLAWR